MTIFEEFNTFPFSIKSYMTERDLDPLPMSNVKLIEFLHDSFRNYYSTYALFSKELISMCEGDKLLEGKVISYLTKLFTFPEEFDFPEIKAGKKYSRKK